MNNRRICLPLAVLLCGALSACSVAGRTGWHWEHPRYNGEPFLSRDLADCRYYASITSPRSFGADHPIDVQEWEEPVQECMAKRGWVFVDSGTAPR